MAKSKYMRDEAGQVIRWTWWDKLTEKHPNFDVTWAKYARFFWWCAKRSANAFGGCPEDYIGFVVIRLNKALQTYRQEDGKFTTYFCANLYEDVTRHVFRYESEAKALWFVRRNYDRQITNVEQSNVYYRIPEKDDPFDEVSKCFNSPDDLWRFLCKGLDPRSIDFVYFRYKYKMTFDQIAREASISKQRVEQIIYKALEKIKKRVGALENWTKLFKVRDVEMVDHYFSEPTFGNGRMGTGHSNRRKSKSKKPVAPLVQPDSVPLVQPVAPLVQPDSVPLTLHQMREKAAPLVQPVAPLVQPVSVPLTLHQMREKAQLPGHTLLPEWQGGILTVKEGNATVLHRFMPLEDAKELCGRLGLGELK